MASERGGRREPPRNRAYNQDRAYNKDSKSSRSSARRRTEPEPENKVLDSVLGFVFSVAISISAFFKNAFGGKNKNYFKIACGTVGVIIVFFAVFLIYRNATKINAQIVYLDGIKIGTIKIPKTGEIEASDIEKLAIDKIMSELDAEISVNEKVTVESVHSKEKFLEPDFVVAEVARKYTYTVSAVSISVDGVDMAVVANKEISKEILDSIINKYYQSSLNITSSEFVEDVQETPVYVDKEEIISKEDAYNILTAESKAEETYIIKDGDTPSKIAVEAGMKLEELLALNPDIEPTKLKIGSTLKLSVSKPVLSVRTFEQVTYRVVKPKITLENRLATQNRGYKEIVQQGKDGEEEITANIIRINGYEEKEREIIDTKIIVAPIDEIIDVGTR